MTTREQITPIGLAPTGRKLFTWIEGEFRWTEKWVTYQSSGFVVVERTSATTTALD